MAKTNFDISKQMRLDLIEAYKKVAPHCWSQQEAYIKTVQHPAPRFYVSPKQAYQVVSRMMQGDFERVDMMMPRKKRDMYYALFKEVEKLSEQRNFIGKSFWYIMQHAVLQPAPEFYIGWQQAKRIRIWMKKDYFDENGKVRDDKVPFYETIRQRYHIKKEKKRQWMLEKMSRRKEEGK